MGLRAEFTVEPFVEGRPGEHVGAAVEALRAAGFDVDVGPFGSAVQGDEEPVLDALAGMLRATIGAGATRVSLQIERIAGG